MAKKLPTTQPTDAGSNFENTLTNFEKYRKEALFTLLLSELCTSAFLKIDAFR